MNTVRNLIVAIGLLFNSISFASIISGDLTTVQGKSVNLSGLEWLSFDDSNLRTIGLTRDSVESANSLWMQAGWRYATESEVWNLFDSLELLDTTRTALNEDGVDFILNNWGSLLIQPGIQQNDQWIRSSFSYRFSGGMYRNTFVDTAGNIATPLASFDEGWTYTLDYFDPNQSDVTTTVDAHVNLRDSTPTWSTNSGLGSFLVRDAIEVSEPSIIFLMTAGLIGLGFARRHRC